ncbi:hypothetical protein GCM10009662_29380 [Catellatospora coxensis]|uniref:Uncharacterized protein n=1 Tax=Catellatospora coxensis TaxID=310354 RepID=A0A8J3LE12_9ACTN|nr:hypothetical protein Cco03nite_76800 [Catellatospora coxensis]
MRQAEVAGQRPAGFSPRRDATRSGGLDPVLTGGLGQRRLNPTLDLRKHPSKRPPGCPRQRGLAWPMEAVHKPINP